MPGANAEDLVIAFNRSVQVFDQYANLSNAIFQKIQPFTFSIHVFLYLSQIKSFFALQRLQKDPQEKT